MISRALDTDVDLPANTPIVGWPIAVPASAAASLFGLSERQWWRLHSAGRVPLPLRIGRACRWDLAELRRWAESGAPARETWQAERSGSE